MKRLRGTIAIVYQPKTRRLMSIYQDTGTRIVVNFNGESYGTAYLDLESTIEGCARTHSENSRVSRGQGDGMALYTGLAALAYIGGDIDCIGSCPSGPEHGPRSFDGDVWWYGARERGLTYEVGGDCDCIALADLIDAGLVFWLDDEGDYVKNMDGALNDYAAAFAAAEPDNQNLNIIEAQLASVLDEEIMQEWRATHAFTANRRGPRRRGRKPSFVTPELEEHVGELYAGLEGL